MRFLPSQIEWLAHILGGGESQGKNKAAHLDTRVRRSILLGCGFSSPGLHYSLRKPTHLQRLIPFLAFGEKCGIL